MGLSKVLFPNRYYSQALDQLYAQFPETKQSYAHYEVEWNKDEPYVLLLNRYQNQKVTRKECYQYYEKKWNYVGYWSRNDCIYYYQWQAWQKNIADFSTLKDYLKYMSTIPSRSTDEECASRFPDIYFKLFRDGKYRK